MKRIFIFFCFFLFFSQDVEGLRRRNPETVATNEILDVVMTIHEKDVPNLDYVIDAVEKNIEKLGKIYIVSKAKYTDRAIWIDEAKYPFDVDDVGDEIGNRGGVGKHKRRHWYYQQLLKLYIFDVIEGLSDYVLILDGDTKPAKKMNFIEDGKIYMDVLNGRCVLKPYYDHMFSIFPEMNKINMFVNPVIHHAVFKRDFIHALKSRVEANHHKPLWKVFLNNVSMKYGTTRRGFYIGASEYMIYYHFCQKYFPEQVITRAVVLRERGMHLADDPPENVDFVSQHKYVK